MKPVRDDVTILNERIKLFAGFLNALGLGLIGFAVLRRVVEDVNTLDLRAALWCGVGFALHGLAHYILGRLRKGTD
ncbi:hypothetical protein [Oceaniglobus indicus]|uniref:hypothetical protein n=1 Tax=Oceaniglobus indicus TaxID=2047749 RepID=UPI000C179903|nr:hypothetical protein [Oceaniglobus indicus]